MDINQEIREALEKASTQHEWDTDGTFVEWKDGHPLKGTYRTIAIFNAPNPIVFKNENHENDAHLFLNAPTWLEYQQEIISRQNIFIHQLRGALGYNVPGDIPENPEIMNGIAQALERQVIEYESKLEIAINTLDWYAKSRISDGGSRARDAISEIQEVSKP